MRHLEENPDKNSIQEHDAIKKKKKSKKNDEPKQKILSQNMDWIVQGNYNNDERWVGIDNKNKKHNFNFI